MPHKSSSAASEISIARFALRIIRAMQSSAARVETAECVAMRSRPLQAAQDCSPSKPIVPVRRPWLPDDATTAEPSMTLGACKASSSAILS